MGPSNDLRLVHIGNAKFPFTDLHSFTDYVIYAQTYLPNHFPPREGAGPDEEWSMERTNAARESLIGIPLK